MSWLGNKLGIKIHMGSAVKKYRKIWRNETNQKWDMQKSWLCQVAQVCLQVSFKKDEKYT